MREKQRKGVKKTRIFFTQVYLYGHFQTNGISGIVRFCSGDRFVGIASRGNKNGGSKMKHALVVLAVLALALPAQAVVTTWTGTAADGKYLTAGNWDNGLPVGDDLSYISNGDTVTIDGAGAIAGTGWDKWLHLNGNSDLQLVAGGDLAGAVSLNPQGGNQAVFTQTGGTWNASSKGLNLNPGAGSSAKFELIDGAVAGAGYLALGYSAGSTCEIIQHAGSIATRSDYPIRINAHSADAKYTMHGGSFETNTVYLGYVYGSGGRAEWDITSTSVDITITCNSSYPIGRLILGGRAAVGSNLNKFITAVEGAPGETVLIKMVSAELQNRCPGYDGRDAQLAGLNNITLQFEGTLLYQDAPNIFEVAGNDLGTVTAGLTNNFALEGLTLGGAEGVALVQLLDVEDNFGVESVGSEALYVENLIIGAGSTLDVAGLNVYYLNGTFDGTVTDSVGGGGVYLIPEPATLSLLAIGGLMALIRRRRA